MPRSDYSDEAVLLEHQEQQEISQLKLRLKKLTEEKRFLQINDEINGYCTGIQRDLLEKEKENISKDYRRADAYTRSKKVEKQAMQMETLIVERHQIYEKIQTERENQADLDSEISKAEQAIHELRLQKAEHKKSAKPTHQKLSHRKMQKKIWVLEEQVHREQASLGKILAENCNMREKISTMSQQRSKFNAHNKSFQDKMLVMRTKINKMIEQANQAYDSTTETRNKIDALEKKARKDTAAFSIEYARLDRIIYHHEQQKQFMATKLFNRNDLLQNQKCRETQELKQQDEQRRRKLELLQNAWTQIIKYLGVKITGKDENVRDSIVEKFLARENENLDILAFISEMQRTNIKLSDELELANDEIQENCYSARSLSKDKEVHILNQLILLADEELEKSLDRQSIQHHKLEKTGKLIEKLFVALRCDESIIDIPMKVGNKYTSKKILRKFLAQIDSEINKLLTQKSLASISPETHIDDIDYVKIYEALGHNIHRINIEKQKFLKPIMKESKSRVQSAKRQESDISIDEELMTQVLTLEQLKEIVKAARIKKREKIEKQTSQVMRPTKLLI